MSYLSRKEVDDLKPSIDKAVYKLLGNSDSSLVSTAIHCVNSGYDRRKTVDKLTSYIDSKRASRLADKIFDLVDDVRSSYRSRKRSRSRSRDRDKDSKRSKNSGSRNHENDREDKTKLSNSKIKEVMQNAQKEIEERKKSFDSVSSKSKPVAPLAGPIPAPSIYGIPTGLLNRGDADKARKIAQLQAQIKNKLSTGILGNVIIQMPVMPEKPTPLILDEEGRTVDKTGKAVTLTQIAPTLKANIRAKKRQEFRSQLSDKISEDNAEPSFYDARIGLKPATRTKRNLRFHEPGKFQQLAERIRMKVCTRN